MNRLLLATAALGLLQGACRGPAPADPAPATPDPAPATIGPAAGSPVEVAPSTTLAVEPGVAAPAVEEPAVEEQAVSARIDAVLGDHTRYRAVIDAYRKAVAAGDREAVAALVGYPLNVTVDGRRVRIHDAATFVSSYDRIVTPDIARVIVAQRYQDLFVNAQGVMFGNGQTWLNGICSAGSADCSEFEVKVIAIQPVATD